MARIFITGSADGLGQLSANSLMRQGHMVVLHARNAERGRDALKKSPGAENVLTGDLSNIDETIRLAHEVNKLGAFDAIIHNAGVYQAAPEDIFAVNVLAPYILTSLIHKPKRLIYLSSGMHMQGHLDIQKFDDQTRITYSDSKLYVLMLAIAAARNWPVVYSNAVDPGWVPTKMGGNSAPDDLQKGYETQTWLATSNDKEADVSGRYFHHKKERQYNAEADDVLRQEKLLSVCQQLTGLEMPAI